MYYRMPDYWRLSDISETYAFVGVTEKSGIIISQDSFPYRAIEVIVFNLKPMRVNTINLHVMAPFKTTIPSIDRREGIVNFFDLQIAPIPNVGLSIRRDSASVAIADNDYVIHVIDVHDFTKGEAKEVAKIEERGSREVAKVKALIKLSKDYLLALSRNGRISWSSLLGRADDIAEELNNSNFVRVSTSWYGDLLVDIERRKMFFLSPSGDLSVVESSDEAISVALSVGPSTATLFNASLPGFGNPITGKWYILTDEMKLLEMSLPNNFLPLFVDGELILLKYYEGIAEYSSATSKNSLSKQYRLVTSAPLIINEDSLLVIIPSEIAWSRAIVYSHPEYIIMHSSDHFGMMHIIPWR